MKAKLLVSRGSIALWMAAAMIAGLSGCAPTQTAEAPAMMNPAVNSGPLDQNGRNCYDTQKAENPTSCP